MTIDHQGMVLEGVIGRLLELDGGRPFVVSVDSASTFGLAASAGVSRCELVEAGVREASAVALALGAASAGVPTLVAAFAGFGLRRGFESLAIHAEPPMVSPLVMLGGLPGLLAARDGVSHHALDDFALARALPGVKAWVPCCAEAVAAAVDDAAMRGGVAYLRAYRGHEVSELCGCQGRDYVVRQSGDGRRVVVGYGPAIWGLRRRAPATIGVIEVSGVHTPSDELVSELRRRDHVIVVDEHRREGGLGAALATAMPKHSVEILSCGNDPGSGSYDDLLVACGIDPQTVIATAMQSDDSVERWTPDG